MRGRCGIELLVQAGCKYLHGQAPDAFEWRSDGGERRLAVRVPLSNNGARDGAEVVQLYARRLGATNARSPLRALVAFRRVAVARGAAALVDLSFPASRLRLWDEKKGDYVVVRGRYELEAGAASDDVRQKAVVEVK